MVLLKRHDVQYGTIFILGPTKKSLNLSLSNIRKWYEMQFILSSEESNSGQVGQFVCSLDVL